MTDYYDILGVSRTASSKEIRRAYLRQCKKWHPDRIDPKENPNGWLHANARFQLINEAHKILKDALARRQYDDLWSTRMGPTSQRPTAVPQQPRPKPSPSPYVRSAKPYNNLTQRSEVMLEEYIRSLSEKQGGFWKNYFLSLSLDNRIALVLMILMVAYVLLRILTGF